jgi:hypothetical protein
MKQLSLTMKLQKFIIILYRYWNLEPLVSPLFVEHKYWFIHPVICELPLLCQRVVLPSTSFEIIIIVAFREVSNSAFACLRHTDIISFSIYKLVSHKVTHPSRQPPLKSQSHLETFLSQYWSIFITPILMKITCFENQIPFWAVATYIDGWQFLAMFSAYFYPSCSSASNKINILVTLPTRQCHNTPLTTKPRLRWKPRLKT